MHELNFIENNVRRKLEQYFKMASEEFVHHKSDDKYLCRALLQPPPPVGDALKHKLTIISSNLCVANFSLEVSLDIIRDLRLSEITEQQAQNQLFELEDCLLTARDIRKRATAMFWQTNQTPLPRYLQRG